MRKIKNRNLNSKKIIGLTSIIVAGGLLASCGSIVTTKESLHTRIEVTNDGKYSESRQFKPYDPNSKKDLPNSFIYYDKWELNENGKYSRIVKEYDVSEKSYDDIKELVNNKNLSIENIVGKPIKTYKQTIESLSEEDYKRDAHFEATFYSEDEKIYVTIQNVNTPAGGLLIASGIALTGGVAGLIAWNKYIEKKNKKLTLNKREN